MTFTAEQRGVKRIFKYALETTDSQIVNMPKGAKILCIQVQYEKPCIWALVDPEKESEPRIFEIFGTGNPVPDRDRRYIGTYQLMGGQLVFHCFEAGIAQYGKDGEG